MKSRVRAALKKGFGLLGYDIVQQVEMPTRPFDVIDMVADRSADELRSRGFLQIGANDGVRSDPIHKLVRKHRIPGLLVEPLSDLFARLQANYADCDFVRFENCAVGDTDGEAIIYRVKPSKELPEWLQGIASFDRSHLTARKFGVPNLESHVVATKVPTLSIASLLAKHGLDDVGLLQVDTEGMDCRIVTWAIEAGLRPLVINYEYVHSPPLQRAACKRLLMDRGYYFLDVGKDTLAVADGPVNQ